MKALSKKTCRIIAVLAAVCLAVAGFAVWYQNRGFFHEGDEAKVHAYLHRNVKFGSNDPSIYMPSASSYNRSDQTERWDDFVENTQAGKQDYIIIAQYTIEGGGIYTYVSYKDGRYYVVRDNSDDVWRGGTYSGEYVYGYLTDRYYSDRVAGYKTGWERYIHQAWLSDDPDFDPDDREGVRCTQLFGVVESKEKIPLEEVPQEERK